MYIGTPTIPTVTYSNPFSNDPKGTIRSIRWMNPSGNVIAMRSISNTNATMTFATGNVDLSDVATSDVEFSMLTNSAALVYFYGGSAKPRA